MDAGATLSGAILPNHLGLILDGNRRWAKEQGIPTLQGHRRGYENLKTIGDAAIEKGIKFISAFVFSTENWNRAKAEVKYLMDLLFWVATHEVEEYHKKNIRVVFLGKETPLPKRHLAAIRKAEIKTQHNTRGTLALCLNYGGQTEIAEAVQQIMAVGQSSAAVTPELIRQHLYHPEVPDIDLIIRTSGEQRLSNFMLWRSAYAELYFCDKHWPAFTEADLDKALAEYSERVRRFGR